MASNTLKSISEIFDRKLFRIPDYQRGYSWEEKHLKAFWDDIERLPENKYHYTGLITLEEVKNLDKKKVWENDLWLIQKQRFTPYHIVDGQQRITTVVILISAILSVLKEEDAFVIDSRSDIIKKYIKLETSGGTKSFIFGYEENAQSYDFFKSNIIEGKESSISPLDIYTRNLHFAKDFFSKKIKHFDLGRLESLYNKITLRLLFNLYEIEDEIDVYITFETTNNRGKALSKLEILKNRLIYLSTILKSNGSIHFEEDKLSLRNCINRNWKTVYEFLGKNENNILDDDDFLKNHVYMYYAHKDKTEYEFADFLLDEQFTAFAAFDGHLSIKDIRDYADSIGISVIEWFKIHNPEHPYTLNELKLDPTIALWLSKIDRLSFKAFNPVLMCLMQKKASKETIIQTLKYIERYIFLVLYITNRKSDTGKNFFYRKANELWSDKITISDFQSSIIQRTTDGHDETLKEFQQQLIKLYDDKAYKGFYNWKGLKYFLFEYELYLRNDGEERVDWRSFSREQTIEHILPQTKKDEYWSQKFGNVSNHKDGELLIFILTNSLGNLLLIKGKVNSRLQNYGFPYKKEEAYRKGSYSEIELCQYEDWTPEAIVDRNIKLMRFLEERWNSPQNSDDKIREILLLDKVLTTYSGNTF